MTFASPVVRVEAPLTAGEKEALTAWLDYQRATLVMKLDGLDDEQLRRPMVPTGLCLLGLVKHLTAVENSWFVVDFARAGEEMFKEDRSLQWRPERDETTDALIQSYLDACERSREITASASLDDTFRIADPSDPRSNDDMDLRWILIHMIEETARHNGHADIIRELIDGVTGD